MDASIVVVEQVHKKLEAAQTGAGAHRAIRAALHEVSGPAFFALLVTAVGVSADPCFGWTGGPVVRSRWRGPRPSPSWSPRFSAVTLDPALRLYAGGLVSHRRRGPNRRHALSAALIRAYTPVVEFALRHKGLVLGSGHGRGRGDDPGLLRIGTELMPPLDEGVLLYMPSTMPGISIAEATRLLRARTGF